MVALRRPDELPAPPEDEIPTRAIKPHTRDKLHYWGCYLEAASTATKKSFPGARVCADLFAGFGVCVDGTTNERVWGSALLSLQVASPFDVYFFNDINPEATEALAQRIGDIGISGASVFKLDLRKPDVLEQAQDIASAIAPWGPKIVVSTGDANLAHHALKALAPTGRRYVCAVIDPQSAIYAWEAFEALAFHERAMDVLVLFPDAMDLQRGLQWYLEHGAKLDRYFDPNANWKSVACTGPRPGPSLRALYERRMQELLGFKIGRARTIARTGTRNAALYRLVFGSRSQRGITIWEDVCRRSRDDQIEMHLPGL